MLGQMPPGGGMGAIAQQQGGGAGMFSNPFRRQATEQDQELGQPPASGATVPSGFRAFQGTGNRLGGT